MVERRSRLDTTLLIVASFIGTMPGAILLGLGLSLRLPFALETRFAIGFGLIFAFWLTAQSLVWLSKTGPRALGWCVAFAAVGGALVGVMP